MKDAVLKSGTHPTLATQSSHHSITLRDSAFDIALRDFRRARAKRGDGPRAARTRDDSWPRLENLSRAGGEGCVAK
eukprot:2615214-Prymnesium_polylepis.1